MKQSFQILSKESKCIQNACKASRMHVMRNFPGLEQKSRSPHRAFGLSYDVEAHLKLKHEVSQKSCALTFGTAV